MSYFDKGRAAKAAYYTALALISFILVVLIVIRFPEIVIPVLLLGLAAIAIIGIWFFIYKILK
jgi:hypothetical protein